MPLHPLHLAGLAPALAWLVLASAPSAWGQTRALLCTRVDARSAPRIDGALSDAAWQVATWYDDFRQSEPDFGRPATEQTRVAFLYDEHNLYVGVRCDDGEPALIRASKLRHRDEPQSDDHVEIVFDTYRDQVRGTVFIVNPLGAKEEGLINGYESYTWDWDDVWQARAAITAAGWQAELRIPFRVLRYGGEAQQVWAVNVERVVRRKQEASYLVPPRPPFDISSLDYAATLSGLEIGASQRNLQLIPYGLAGVARRSVGDAGERSRSLDQWGFDVKYSLTPGLTLDGTYNTDFAQVEADAEQVNLTRFSLFYPEKRGFFLENAQLFSFGHFGGDPAQPDIAAFFSRRIGLYDGTTVPIDAGLRVTGKVGRQDVGVLSVRTGGVPGLALPAAWYNVARVRHDLGERSYVGVIATDSRRGGFRSTTAGIDGDWFITRELSLRADYLRVADSAAPGARNAYDVSLDLTTDPWGFLFGWYDVDTGFNPDLGFVSRDGYRRGQAYLRRSFRPERLGVRRISVVSSNDWYESLRHGVRETGDNSVSCEIELESGDSIEVRVAREFERLFEPFELDPRVILPPGDYTFTSATAGYYSDDSRRLGFDVDTTAGGFYDGSTHQLGGESWVVFSRHLRAAGGYSTVDVTSPHGDLAWRLWSVRLDYTHSANLSASAYLQYNSSIRARVLNLRLRWILPNDSDLYLVYNEGRQGQPGAPDIRDREVALKLTVRLFV